MKAYLIFLSVVVIVMSGIVMWYDSKITDDVHKLSKEQPMKVEPAPVQPDNTTAKILENDSLFKASTENFLLNLRAGNQEGMAFWQGVTIALHYAMFHEWAYDGVPRQVLTNYKKPKAVKK